MKEVKEAEVQTNENPIEDEKILTAIGEDGEEVEEVSSYIILPDITLSRKTVKKSGKVYNDYFVNGTLRGVPVQVRVRPAKDTSGFTDVNAYNYLGIVFGDATTVEFAVRSSKRRDLATNRVVSRLTHYAYVKDVNDGVEYTAPLRFETASDQAMIAKMIEVSNLKHSLGIIL